MTSELFCDTFHRLLREGMSHGEAMECFSDEDRNSALSDLRIEDSRKALDLMALGGMQQRDRKTFNAQCIPLMLAGWTSEIPNPTNSKDPWMQCQAMSLYWRAPSKCHGKLGRKYLSTQQAYNAMMKSNA